MNLEESAMLSRSFARVRIDDIVEVLEARFPGALPADLGERLALLDRDPSRKLADRCLDPVEWRHRYGRARAGGSDRDRALRSAGRTLP